MRGDEGQTGPLSRVEPWPIFREETLRAGLSGMVFS